MEITSPFYLYIYPILSSVVAGFIFWIVFSLLPDRQRRSAFSLGISYDFERLDAQIFGYLDAFMSSQKREPSFLQKKIHACELTREEVLVALQNKVIAFNNLPPGIQSEQFLEMGAYSVKVASEIDITINRLYAFTYFLTGNQVALLRNLQQKVHRYVPYFELKLGTEDNWISVDPSLSFMATVLLEIQDDFRQLRKLLYSRSLENEQFKLNKILYLFHSGQFKKCIKECKRVKKRGFANTSLQRGFLVYSLLKIGKNTHAYMELRELLNLNKDLIGHRSIFSQILKDREAYEIVLSATSQRAIDDMNRLVESEAQREIQFFQSNSELRRQFSRHA
ncbi:MAG: hypothetical protein KF686_00865 [Ramlibacter sp.]|nr:hypothetical protein [Ramlibacter sp.]